jgi:hypothetical protein
MGSRPVMIEARGGCARRLRVARGEQRGLGGQLVDVGRGCAHGDPAAVAAEVPPADVVEEDHEHIRPLTPLPPGSGPARRLPALPVRE